MELWWSDRGNGVWNDTEDLNLFYLLQDSHTITWGFLSLLEAHVKCTLYKMKHSFLFNMINISSKCHKHGQLGHRFSKYIKVMLALNANCLLNEYEAFIN